MPPRDDELPEGTDHIINGAMETGGGDAGAGGTSGGAAAGGGSSSGFIGASGGDGTGGTAASGGGTSMTATEGTGGGTGGGTSAGGDISSGGLAATGGTDTGTGGGGTGSTGGTGGGGGGGGNVGEQLKGQVYSLRDQAGGKVRTFAEDGKTRATDMLEELSRVVADTADSIDERLGNNYGEYARKAADGVSGFADSLRGKDVDELYDDVRSAVRKSPGVAIGIAAVLGFTLVRLVKAGLDEDGGSNGGGRRTGGGGGGTGA